MYMVIASFVVAAWHRYDKRTPLYSAARNPKLVPTEIKINVVVCIDENDKSAMPPFLLAFKNA